MIFSHIKIINNNLFTNNCTRFKKSYLHSYQKFFKKSDTQLILYNTIYGHKEYRSNKLYNNKLLHTDIHKRDVYSSSDKNYMKNKINNNKSIHNEHKIVKNRFNLIKEKCFIAKSIKKKTFSTQFEHLRKSDISPKNKNKLKNEPLNEHITKAEVKYNIKKDSTVNNNVTNKSNCASNDDTYATNTNSTHTNFDHRINSFNESKDVNVINMLKKKIVITHKENKIVSICNRSSNAAKCVYSCIKKVCKQIKLIILQPSLLIIYYNNMKKNIKHTLDWVKTGILLFLTNMKISKNLIIKRLKGHRLSYSEYKLLIRTMNDMLKLIPFSFFIIIPFAEFLLPVFLKIYPNLLPSTFKNENHFKNIKKNLYAKQQLAKFLQQLIEEKEKQLNDNIDIDSNKKKTILNKFHQQLISKDEKDVNPFLNTTDTLKIAKIFKEDFVLDQMNLKTLQTICHLLGLKPYSMHYHVVLQLRYHFLRLQREDRELIYEGIDNLKQNTLIEICKDRGMNFNTTEKEMKLQIQQWLQLASIKEVPYILLLYIRCVVITHSIMDIHDPNKEANLSSEKTTKTSNIDDKQKLIQEAKEKLDDLKMKEEEIKKNINVETNEEGVKEHKDKKMKFNLKKNKYMQNELDLLKHICDVQHKELKVAFTSLTDLAEKKESCDINEIIKNMSDRLLTIEKHISELNAHKQVEMDEYFYPEEEKIGDITDLKG